MIKNIIHILILILFTGNLLAQNSYEIKFKENIELSDRKGKPTNIEVGYFPVVPVPFHVYYVEHDNKKKRIPNKYLSIFVEIFGNESIIDSVYYNGIDILHQKWYSRYLYEFGEPILYNYYMGKDIIRLTYLRSFGKPIMIKLENYNDSTRLCLKTLSKKIDIEVFKDILRGDFTTISTTNKLTDLKERKILRINKSSYFIVDSLIQNTKIKEEVPFYNVVEGEDGSDWILEIHHPEGYYYINRWSPDKDSALRKIADYLIEISKTKEWIY